MNKHENVKYYNVEKSQNIKKLLIENIEHHKMIMKLVRNGYPNKEALAIYGSLTIWMFQQLTQISIIFESIASESETIKDAIYDLPWESMDLKNRKIVLSFLSHAQTPITFKASGLISVGVRTMAEIIKTSFSYYLMLHTAAKLEA
ncbi:unnamed protein product, partial [Brenthis ino]